jgi:hypothetical protein
LYPRYVAARLQSAPRMSLLITQGDARSIVGPALYEE